MPTVIPSGVTTVDTRDGNHFEIYTVFHDGTNVTDIAVSDNCVSASVLVDDITSTVVAEETSTSAGITVRNQTSGTSGLSFGDWQTSDGMKQITIAASVASGIYYVVARFAGSGAGAGSGAKTLDF